MRYFFIAFEATSALQKISVRSSMCITTGGEYPNKTKIIQTIHKCFKLSKAYISNIIELSESDYNDFIAEN